MTLYTNKEINLSWEKEVLKTFEIVETQPTKEVVYKIISDDIK